MANYLQSFYSIRFGDCDPFSHLNNARYIDYLLNARQDHLRDYYQMDLADFYQKGRGWVVIQHEIVYLRPASFNELVCIRSGLLDAGPEHLKVEMLMLDSAQKQLKALMHTKFIPVSLTTGRKEPHTPEFMEFLSDKVLPGLKDNVPSPGQRVEYWQQLLRSAQTV
ncbi:MAG: acyl-CoA thioesterase [Bacteroidota bacterium]|nr:acyl-CoA thioesterase [Bacteroidota bacterium]